MYQKSVVLFYFLLFSLCMSYSCIQENRIKVYYKIKNCKRSDSNMIGRTSVSSLKDCAAYAKEKNALAFNFSPPEAVRKRKKAPTYNCHALGCPELNNFTSLINDTMFDYYSSYGNATVLENATCVRSVGVFRLLHDKFNYTTAVEQCQNIYSDLAHVLSETRTIQLSKILSSITDWYKAAYIGLDDRTVEGRYETPLGDPISCYKYRAWSPGHPRNLIRSDDCVILDIERTWKLINCKIEMAALCELYPTPPDKYKNKYLNVECEDLDESAEREECRVFKKIDRRVKKRRRRNRCFE